MKNKRYIKEMDAVKFSGDFEQRVLEVSDAEVRKPKARGWLRPAVCAAALVVVVAVGAIAAPLVNRGERIELEKSDSGASAWYPKRTNEKYAEEGCLIDIPEEDLICRYSETLQREMAIFRGTVTEQRNIVLSAGDLTMYNSVARVSVIRSYCGGAARGETVELLLPCQAYAEGGERVTSSIAGIAEDIKVGDEAIFVAQVADDTAYIEARGVRLYYSDVCEFLLGEGMRTVFLESDGELVYADYAYPSFEGARTLDDAEAIILEMLKDSTL